MSFRQVMNPHRKNNVMTIARALFAPGAGSAATTVDLCVLEIAIFVPDILFSELAYSAALKYLFKVPANMATGKSETKNTVGAHPRIHANEWL